MLVKNLLKPILLFCALAFAGGLAHAADSYAPRPITKEQRCPVCGMYPANYPKWHAQVIFKDGGASAFDSAADMFRFLHGMGKYDKKHTPADIGGIYVPDHAKGGWLDARRAFFVAGSSAKGPMGNDLPAFNSKENAMKFSRESGGRVLGFDQVTAAVVEGLRGGNNHLGH